ncbi:GGDEF domain-containing protein [Roseateles toxinivorans]|uniref:diguanylate cyclase n=1 Tax=Roseateles toxinivorans TaxID=270368 RepID=A0A4R6QK57_9BURK|nr:GGDEF domain-containing protein [Roseateles toxinivorans]TDP63293.1 diguanylate cyclase (GGDEF)-like protein [Roseateles toxinivorans]
MNASALSSLTDLLAPAVSAAARGNHKEGLRLLDEVLASCEPDDNLGRATCLRLLSLNHNRLGNLETAARLGGEALALYANLSDAAGESEALCTLTLTYTQIGLNKEALEFGLRALQAAEQTGELKLRCWALNRVGLAYAALKQHDNALAHTARALSLAKDLGDDEILFANLNNLASQNLVQADQLRQQGDAAAALLALTQAEAQCEQAIAVAQRAGNPMRECIALVNRTEVALQGKRFDEAEALVQRYHLLAAQHAYPSIELHAEFDWVTLLQHKDLHEEAVTHLQALESHPLMAGDSSFRLSLFKSLYESHKQLRQFEPALAALEQHAALDRQAVLRTADVQARVMMGRLQVEQAELAAEQSRLDAERQRLRATQLEQEQLLLRAQAAEWVRAAREDTLTGLGNRRVVDEALPGLLARAHAEQLPLSIAMADVDHFKIVNDRFGHGVGDQVLVILGQLLRANTRSTDVLARMGGEEFMMVLVGTPIEQAHDICERLRQAVAQHDWNQCAPGLRVTLSTGLVDRSAEFDSLRLVERADRALYAAKHQGRNCVVRH